MNKYPEIQWSFKMKMAGEGKDLQEAFHDAVMNSGLEEHDGSECEPVIDSFICPCGQECMKLPSADGGTLAADYVCKVDGRRWSVDWEGDVYERERWVVLTKIIDGWENTWLDDHDGEQYPSTFPTQWGASFATSEHMRGATLAFIQGYMQDVPTEKDHKIVRLREYLNLDELESVPDGWHFGAKIYDASGHHYVNQYVTDYGDKDVKIEWMLGKSGWEAHWEGSEEAFYIGSFGDLPTREDFVEAHDILHNQGGVL